MNLQQSIAAFRADSAQFAARGVTFHPDVEPRSYVPDGWGSDFNLAMDAQPTLATSVNSGVPWQLTNLIDPQVYKILFTPNKAAQIYGERGKGSWLDETAMFPTVEHTGEVTSYGDFAESGHAGANTNWPQRQAYLFQTVKEYGERELERAGLARINWVTELDQAAATVLSKFSNLTYFFGVQGLQNYGALNDPSLTTALTPSAKAFGNNRWVTSGVVTATANEVFTDIQSLFLKLVNQTNGLVESTDRLVLAMSPQSDVALTATNTFNVNVRDLLKKNFPSIRFETAIQFGATSTSNPQGQTAGELVQMFVERIEGQETIYVAFNAKMRTHPIIRAMSSFKQKVTGGTWGAIIRMPVAIAAMVGV
jgi:hypothetical protein